MMVKIKLYRSIIGFYRQTAYLYLIFLVVFNALIGESTKVSFFDKYLTGFRNLSDLDRPIFGIGGR